MTSFFLSNGILIAVTVFACLGYVEATRIAYFMSWIILPLAIIGCFNPKSGISDKARKAKPWRRRVSTTVNFSCALAFVAYGMEFPGAALFAGMILVELVYAEIKKEKKAAE